MNKNKVLSAALAAVAAGFLARSEYEKKHFEVKNYKVSTNLLDSAWTDYKMVFLSDLHDNSFGNDNEKLKDTIASIHPDSILIGGDMMVTKGWKIMDFSILEDLLDWLTARYPVYYANGNHESRMHLHSKKFPGWYAAFRQLLTDYGVTYLSDNTAAIMRGASSLYIHGLNLSEKCYDKPPIKALPDSYINKHLGSGEYPGFHLLLAHSPLYAKNYRSWGANLVLSGHFHGGTIRIPRLGGLMTPQFQFFSRYTRNWITQDEMPMIISSGLGTHSINIRINNKPQLIVLTLQADPSGTSKCRIIEE